MQKVSYMFRLHVSAITGRIGTERCNMRVNSTMNYEVSWLQMSQTAITHSHLIVCIRTGEPFCQLVLKLSINIEKTFLLVPIGILKSKIRSSRLMLLLSLLIITSLLTFWLRTFLQILAHPVFKM